MAGHFYRSSDPDAIASFRAVTEDRGVMLNAQIVPKLSSCICCGKRRTTATGKTNKAGKFVCGMCANPRRVS